MQHNCHIVPIIKSTCVFQAVSSIFSSVAVDRIASSDFSESRVHPKGLFGFPCNSYQGLQAQ